MITAKVICDSISPSGVRLTTMELNYPRFIHSEFMTHRMFSRNASSSRAIPVKRMIKQVAENPAMPIHWGKNQAGMQAREEIDHLNGTYLWEDSAQYVAENCRIMADFGYHKQIVNRLLEPFQWIKVIVTATEWDNFFKLRLHKDAQPEMMVLAEHMKKAMDESIPTELHPGEWHLPYISVDDCLKTTTDNFVKLSVARCARVSYLNHDNSTPNIDKDIALADKLLEAGHMSPFEHQATPMPAIIYENKHPYDCDWVKGVTHQDRDSRYWSGNFRSWVMHRQLIG